MGVNAVSWAPAMAPGAMLAGSGGAGPAGGLRRFVTGGSDCMVKVWEFRYVDPVGRVEGEMMLMFEQSRDELLCSAWGEPRRPQ
jgi:hypothetical protein